MTREQVYEDMRQTLGVIPSFFQWVPDNTLEQEWDLFKRLQLDTGVVPGKYRELIGLGVAAATKCPYCMFYHSEVAKAYGATDAEIEEAVHFAKCSTGWSTYLHGLGADYEQFKSEIRQACEHMRQQAPVLI
jgi:AhpD family alkylhydroperoxidase